MSKHKKNKKKDKKSKAERKNAAAGDLQTEVERLLQENEQLRARLDSIAEPARTPLPTARKDHDVEDEDYEELTHDVDDQIADGKAAQHSAAGDGASRS
jgi:hypothetical protein